MITCAIIAFTLAASPVEDYFPLIPGTKWTYEDANGLQMVQEVGQPIEIGKGQSVTPIVMSSGGRTFGSNLYGLDGDTMKLFGVINGEAKAQANMFKLPEPILRVGSTKMEWQYLGELPTEQGPVLVQVRADSNKGPRRAVLGREAESITVHAFIRYGNEAANGVEVHQAMVYAKGIGMIETTEATKALGQTVKKVLKLVKFEPPQG